MTNTLNKNSSMMLSDANKLNISSNIIEPNKSSYINNNRREI